MTPEPPAAERTGRARAGVGWFWRLFGAVVVAFRIPILVGWIVAAVLATVYLPQLRRPDRSADWSPGTRRPPPAIRATRRQRPDPAQPYLAPLHIVPRYTCLNPAPWEVRLFTGLPALRGSGRLAEPFGQRRAQEEGGSQ